MSTFLQPTLVQHFDLIAEAPGGVARLRELILTLAVRGLLVPQDPSDEPASVLLQKIRAEKDRLIAEGKIKRGKPLEEIADEEKPFELPVGWSWEPLGLLGNIFSGNSINAAEKEAKFAGVAGHPFIATKDVGYGLERLDYENGIRIPFSEHGFKVAHAGAVLMCAEGGSAGKKCGLVDQDICFGNKLFANEPFAGISSKFILFVYLTPSFFDSFKSSMTGIIGGISLAKFLELPIPLPPLAEQYRIVTRVEELMQLCDALEVSGQLESQQHIQLVNTLLSTLTRSETPDVLADNWQRIATHFDLLLDRPEAVDALEQTILQLAVRGLLVPQDPSDEPASVLLQKIRAEKDRLIAEGKIKRGKPLEEIADEEKPFELPPGWEWARFPELGEFGRGKSKHRPRNDPALFNPPIYPVVQTGEVARAKGVIQEYHSKYSEIGLSQSRLWPEGTLCITIAANIADAALLGFDACFPDSVVGFVPAQALGNAKYFLAFMETARNDLIKFAPATAQKNINLEILGALLIPVPPLAEISRIVTRVNELRALCSDLRAMLNSQKSTASNLAEALIEAV